MSDVNPSDFIIARKRKKYRFALFKNANNCFEFEEWKIWDDARPLIIELGAGTALFLVQLASKYPDQRFIAIDVKADRLQKGAHEALEQGLDNIRFVRARADQLREVIADGSVNELWLTFSDPFPRESDAKRRLTAPRFLELYKQILRPSGVLRQKTDDHNLFDWSLEQLVTNGWTISELSYDLHASTLPEDYKYMTTYEYKWQAEGLKTYYLSAITNSAVI
ncbi:MAG: tRNA (guanosine(46)-N7)-methyltransferase TrmB [Candidatus Saccharimonadales bacterium]